MDKHEPPCAATMIRDLNKKVGTEALTAWETDFVESLVVRMNAGQVMELQPRQVHCLKSLHSRVILGRVLRQPA